MKLSRRYLNIPGFRVCQVSAYASVAQGFKYAWIWLNIALRQGPEYVCSKFHRIFLYKLLVLNMLGTGIRQGCEYARVLNMSE